MTAWPAETVFAQLTRAFEASQDFPRREVVQRQTALIERLVRHAAENVPFYRDSGRLKPLFRADGSFDFAGWKDVPVLTRAEAKDNEEALRATRIPPDVGPAEASMTSGSTGAPLRFRRVALQLAAAEALVNRLLRWHNVWPVERVAMQADGTTSPIPGVFKVSGRLSFREQAEFLRRERITHSLVAPSIAAGWIEAAGQSGLPDLVAVVTTGEVLKPETRRAIERRPPTRVIDLYSTSELGPVAGEGPDGRLRVFEETLLLEGPSAAPDPARPVRVIATPFYAFAMPLIRYAPGDYVRFSASEGKRATALRRLEAVIGRQRNLLREPDGAPFLPGGFTAAALTAILDCRDWQLVQTSLDAITFRIVPTRPPTAAEVERLRAFVARNLKRHRTDVVFVDRIENNLAGGKAYEMFLSLVGSE